MCLPAHHRPFGTNALFFFTERAVVIRTGLDHRITRNTTSRIRVTTTDTAMEPAIPRRLEKNTNMATRPPVRWSGTGRHLPTALGQGSPQIAVAAKSQ
jgi:hypothetical protein